MHVFKKVAIYYYCSWGFSLSLASPVILNPHKGYRLLSFTDLQLCSKQVHYLLRCMIVFTLRLFTWYAQYCCSCLTIKQACKYFSWYLIFCFFKLLVYM